MPRTLRPCAQPGCPVLTTTRRCDSHTKTLELARGTRQQRGYGRHHEKTRASWERDVQAGLVDCSRCGVRILPGQAWHLDHTDDRTAYRGPSHSQCNLSAGGRAAHGRS